jgi:hypothetical protein
MAQTICALFGHSRAIVGANDPRACTDATNPSTTPGGTGLGCSAPHDQRGYAKRSIHATPLTFGEIDDNKDKTGKNGSDGTPQYGGRVFVEFPTGIRRGEMPPLWVIGPEGGGELVNYCVRDHHMIVDRLFAAAELRLGADHQKIVRVAGRTEVAAASDSQPDDTGPPDRRGRPPSVTAAYRANDSVRGWPDFFANAAKAAS